MNARPARTRRRALAGILTVLALALVWSIPLLAQESAAASGPPLTSDQIRAAMLSQRQEVRNCVFSQRSDLPSQLDMVVEFTVGEQGAVRNTSMHESNTANNSVDDCVIGVVDNIQFPAPSNGRPFAVRYRFFFVTGN